jgi:hypothetical protein
MGLTPGDLTGNAAYLAACVDARGVIARDAGAVSLTYRHPDPRIPEILRELSGLGRVLPADRDHGHGWVVEGDDAVAVLRAVRPYLIVKGPAVDDVLGS